MRKKELINRGILLINKKEVKEFLDMEKTINTVEKAYTAYFLGKTIQPPVVNLTIPDCEGELDIKSAYSSDLELIGIKAASGFYHNPIKFGISSGTGIIVLMDGETGFALSVMDGSYITTVRTGAAGAVGAKYLARKNSQHVFILGAGSQGRIQLKGLQEVLPELQTVLIYDLNRDNMKRFIEEMSPQTGLKIEEAESIEEGARNADVIITVTPSHSPQIKASWIKKGAHVNAIGSDGPGKQELDPEIFKSARVVVDCWNQVKVIGECQHAIKAGYLKEDGSNIWAEIGEITSGHKSGRENENEITLFDATGMAVLDVATAGLVYHSALDNHHDRYFQSLID